MRYLGKFEKYEPSERAAPNANHLKNEKGEDWYSYSWNKDLTTSGLFLCTNDEGYVANSTKDGHLLFPAGLHVYYVESSDPLYSRDAEELYHGIIENNIFKDKTENPIFILNDNKRKKSLALKKLRNLMSIYHVDLSLGTLSEDDKNILTKYSKAYKEVVALDENNVDMKIPDF